MSPNPKRVVIVGGGLSGLSLAFRLRERLPAAGITVIERSLRLGGPIYTVERDGFRVECGPNGIFDAKPSTIQLCQDLGLGERLIAASEASRKNRYLFLNGKLRALPGSLRSFITSPVLSWRAKISILTERYRKRPPDVPGDESVAEFARRRAGREVADTLADALVTGIHAGDPELLSVQAAFPRLAELEREYGSVLKGIGRSAKRRREEARARGESYQPRGRMWSFRSGLRFLIESLCDRLRKPPFLGVAVQKIEKEQKHWLVRAEGKDFWTADAVLLTSPAYQQAAMIADMDRELAERIGSIAYTRLAVI